jgi:hypothetical protein
MRGFPLSLGDPQLCFREQTSTHQATSHLVMCRIRVNRYMLLVVKGEAVVCFPYGWDNDFAGFAYWA